jgi:integrase
LALVRAILRKRVNEWEWLEGAPHVRMLREPSRRIRFLTREQAEALLAHLPEHLADMAAFALATGLCAANVTGLQWSQVDSRVKLRGCIRTKRRLAKRFLFRSTMRPLHW